MSSVAGKTMPSTQQIGEFELHSEMDRTEACVVYRAAHESLGSVRLTLFSEAVSSAPGFRAAFRRDQPQLERLHHAHVVAPLTWGEADGLFYYVTSLVEGQTLAERLATESAVRWDEAIDLGWQISSAVQRLHNVGLTHGALGPARVVVSPSVRAQLTGSCVATWIAQSGMAPVRGQSFADRAADDLQQLAALLTLLIDSAAADSDDVEDPDALTELRAFLRDLREHPERLSARDVQGVLGDLLLRVSGDSFELVDHRDGQVLSRRSIVDELFEDVPPHSEPHPHPESQPVHASSALKSIVLIVVAVLTFIAILAVASRYIAI